MWKEGWGKQCIWWAWGWGGWGRERWREKQEWEGEKGRRGDSILETENISTLHNAAWNRMLYVPVCRGEFIVPRGNLSLMVPPSFSPSGLPWTVVTATRRAGGAQRPAGWTGCEEDGGTLQGQSARGSGDPERAEEKQEEDHDGEDAKGKLHSYN